MERRELLRALIALPAAAVVHNEKTVGLSYEVEQKSKYVVLLNAVIMDVDEFCDHCDAFPAGTPVHVVKDGDMDNAIRIFKVTEE